MIDLSTGKEMTRREFGVGLSAIIAAGVAPSIAEAATGARRGLGMRAGMMGGGAKAYDVQDYVGWGTSDLVAMWDGIRNVGATADHNSSSTTWVNIVDGQTATVRGTVTWNDKASVLNGNTYWDCGSNYNSKIVKGICTIEFVVSSSASSGTNAGIISINDYSTDPRKLWIFSQKPTEDGRVHLFYNSRSSDWPRTDVSVRDGVNSEWGSGLPHNFGLVVSSNVCHGFTDGTIDKRGSGFTSNYTNPSNYGSLVIGYIYSFGKMAGNVYCVRIYNRALTAQEVAANYAVDAARFGITPIT